ncbi:Tyrosine-sulfated glycopeptide receptor 1 [Morella rubra]|uniref:Tyrosine-sulfated glycopeptide receptor 1 n=1 Tax=Morella rubra TaxID=262757 RepID=A0A6A1V3Y8_9ROSI|nr:Tyrosine-sulfated glycopeptide receptor 1 [Morella rubra]
MPEIAETEWRWRSNIGEGECEGQLNCTIVEVVDGVRPVLWRYWAKDSPEAVGRALPPSLMNFTNLIELKLAVNFFEGEISTLNFSGLSQLPTLDLAANDFTCNFSACLYSCKFLKSNPTFNNRLEGEIQTDVVQLKFLTLLSLTESKLTNITKAINILMHCKALNILILKGNFVQDPVPTDASIVSSTSFTNLRLIASNKLHEPIPSGTQLQSFDASDYEGNPDFVASTSKYMSPYYWQQG